MSRQAVGGRLCKQASKASKQAGQPQKGSPRSETRDKNSDRTGQAERKRKRVTLCGFSVESCHTASFLVPVGACKCCVVRVV